MGGWGVGGGLLWRSRLSVCVSVYSRMSVSDVVGVLCCVCTYFSVGSVWVVVLSCFVRAECVYSCVVAV